MVRYGTVWHNYSTHGSATKCPPLFIYAGDVQLDEEARPLGLALSTRCPPRLGGPLLAAPPGLPDLTRPPPPVYEIARLQNERRKQALAADLSGYRACQSYSQQPGTFASVTSPACRNKTCHETPRHERRGIIPNGDCRPTVSPLNMDSTLPGDPVGPRPVMGHRRRRARRTRDISLDRMSQGSSRPAERDKVRVSRSASNRLQKTFSLRHKENPVRHITELSTEETTPGVLKIFGDSVSPGAQYKSVLATLLSTAKELVKEALQRYNIDRGSAADYALCEVLGRLVAIRDPSHKGDTTESVTQVDTGSVWVEDCMRLVGDDEHPLTLQAFWKPRGEHSRRFELRKRSDISPVEVDTLTSGINANARKMLILKTRTETIPGVNIRKDEDNRVDATSMDLHGREATESQVLSCVNRAQGNHTPPTPECSPTGCNFPHQRIRPPTSQPYFLTLKWYNNALDDLVYIIHERVTLVGNPSRDANQGDICLKAPDILPEHCWLCKTPGLPQDTSGPPKTVIYLDPLPNAPIRINNRNVDKTAALTSGDIIHIGHHYVFLFKDPTCGDNDLTSVENLTVCSSLQQRQVAQPETLSQDTVTANVTCSDAAPEKHNAPDRLKFYFTKETEDALLTHIVNVMGEHPEGYQLTPAYLLAMGVEHASGTYDQQSLIELVVKITTILQDTVWVGLAVNIIPARKVSVLSNLYYLPYG